MKKSITLIKLIFTCALFLILVILVILRRNDIFTVLNNYIFYQNKRIVLEEKNEYYRDRNFTFIQNIENIYPTTYQDLLNVYYSFLNAGQTTFSFYCPNTYQTCIDAIQRIANDENILSSVNNYVHPYNSFSHIETTYDSLGKVTVDIIHNYTNTEIQQINQKIDELYPQLVSPNNSIENNIQNIHDYIINHTKYDSDRSDHNIIRYKSDLAYGPLLEGYAICGGYTDLMELFLEKMGLESFKVSSNKHIWNVVNIHNEWLHIDLTWDDPVASDNHDYLEHTYFLITTSKLLQTEKTEHNFISNYYQELMHN